MGSVGITGGRGLEWLAGKSYPYSDAAELELSTGEFDGGGQYGVEIPVVNSLAELERLVKLIGDHGLYVTRFNETRGSFLLSDSELSDMFALCRENEYGLVVSIGPRPEYDVKGSFYRSEFGLEMGRQINNSDAFRACVEEALRLAALGCRGITVYDIGVLRVLDEMRREGALPAEMVFKTSSHCMATNPFLARIFAENGADSITLAHDLGVPMIHQIRRLNPGLPMDVPTDVYKAKGGFIRFYELAEIVQVGAPVMLKMGASVQGHPYDRLGEAISRERVDRVARGIEVLDQHLPRRTAITTKSRHYGLPAAR
ncbi:peptidase [Actinosynnema sp. NPDC023658]|uniref:U32 family peptidase n=1 Tax=Actinosynnema sp. NPDC023658 TaxID=3155465 RepID=UPI0033C908DF